jgi:hypothetical protein
MSKLTSNHKKHCITLLSVLLSLQNVFADIPGVWGNIVKIDDFGSVSQRSIAGFRIDNSASPFEINYLGSSNDSIQFNNIPNNFVTPDGAEHTFDNRFNNLFVNETKTKSGDVIDAQAFFKICPPQYSDKCVYFKIVSQHQDYGYYYAAEAPKKHQLDFDGYIKNLTTGTGIGLGIGGASIGLASLAYGSYKIIRHYRSKNSLHDEIDKLNGELASHVHDIHSFGNSNEYKSYHTDLDEYNKLIETHAKLKQDHLKMQKLLEENIRFCEPKKLHELKLN